MFALIQINCHEFNAIQPGKQTNKKGKKNLFKEGWLKKNVPARKIATSYRPRGKKQEK